MKIVETQKPISVTANKGPKVENKLQLIEAILVIIIKQIKVVKPVIKSLPTIPNTFVDASTAKDCPMHEIVIPTPYAAELQNDLPDIAAII